MEKEIKKEYTNGEITVVWKPEKCIHAGECVKALPNVYRPKEKPWIKAENASVQELKDQIAKCPSGALSYVMNGEENEETPPVETAIEVLPNGPLLVYGTLQVKDKDGNITIKSKRTSFCRCGASGKKPYCDGTHRKIGFEG